MAENKKSVLLYCDIIHTVEELDDVDAGLLFKHYLRYINDQDPEPPSKLIKIVFEPIKQNLKRDLRKWEEKSIKNSESARIRWDKNNANASERIERNANHADKDTVTDKVNVNVTVNDNGKVIEIKTLSWFEKQIDSMYFETLQMTHKGKDVSQAIKEAYNHVASDSLRLHNLDGAGAKRLVNTWLTNSRLNGHQKERKKLL
jgi:hypothetical protein